MALALHHLDQPSKRLWTVDEYRRLCEAGFVGIDERVELLEGEIVNKMGQNPPHITSIRASIEALRIAFGEGFDINSQLPIETADSAPEPDFLVLKGSWRDYINRFPQAHEVVLVGEVADESRLAFDRTTKLRIYARAGFAEYWIVNLVDRRLEVYRQPLPEGLYGDIKFLGLDEEVLPLRESATPIKVADLIPTALPTEG